MAIHSMQKTRKAAQFLTLILLALVLVSCSCPLLKEGNDESAGAPVIENSYPVAPNPVADTQAVEQLEQVADSEPSELVESQYPLPTESPVVIAPVAVEPSVPAEQAIAVPVSESVANDLPDPEVLPESSPASDPADIAIVHDDTVSVASEQNPAPAPMAEMPAPEPMPAPTVHSPPPEVVVPPSAPPVSAPPEPDLDMEKLGTRLRSTKAIGLFTKLELKSQVEDLLDELEDYHESKSTLELEQLEEHFNLLVMKLLLLLQDDDPQLHSEIARARPALWTTLADPNQFSSMKGT